MLPLAERQQVLRAAERQRWLIRDRLESYAVNLWGSMGSWRDADIDAFVDLIAPRIQAGQVATANITNAYLARVLEDEGIFAGVMDVSTLRGGVTADEVYRRPAKTLYNELAQGKPFTKAQSAAANRLANLLGTDLELAYRGQAHHSLSRSNAAKGGYRRVLTGRENCALCIIASTQRYHRGDLMPIHPACDCGIEPLAPGENVGQVIEPERLEATHNWVEAVAGTSDKGARVIDGEGDYNDYMDLIAVRDHGEYGPTLSWRRHHHTGPDDIGS